MKKIVILIYSVLLVLVCLPVAISSAASDTLGYFTVVVLPDTQNYSRHNPEIFNCQTQWVVDNAEAENIVFVAHVGDLIKTGGSDTEWGAAKVAMNTLESSDIPYSVLPGNHDADNGTNTFVDFNRHFPVSDVSGYDWYGTNYWNPGGVPSNENNYALITASGRDLLIIHLGVRLWSGTYGWTNLLCDMYSDREVIIVTHAYIDIEGSKETAIAGSPPAEELWNLCLSQHENIIMVLSGHHLGEKWTSDVGEYGNIVHNLLSNYQHRDSGGNGWLRLYRFYDDETVEVLTYSPYLDQFEYDVNSHFQFNINVPKEVIPTSDFTAIVQVGSDEIHYYMGRPPEDLTREELIQALTNVLSYQWKLQHILNAISEFLAGE